jgi:hypothetical protein
MALVVVVVLLLVVACPDCHWLPVSKWAER